MIERQLGSSPQSISACVGKNPGTKISVKNYMSGKAEHCVYPYQSGGGNCLSKKL